MFNHITSKRHFIYHSSDQICSGGVQKIIIRVALRRRRPRSDSAFPSPSLPGTHYVVSLCIDNVSPDAHIWPMALSCSLWVPIRQLCRSTCPDSHVVGAQSVWPVSIAWQTRGRRYLACRTLGPDWGCARCCAPDRGNTASTGRADAGPTVSRARAHRIRFWQRAVYHGLGAYFSWYDRISVSVCVCMGGCHWVGGFVSVCLCLCLRLCLCMCVLYMACVFVCR
jgi:hypothetical protein